MLVALLAATPLVIASHYGGTLVYGYGVVVQQLPDTDDRVHNDHAHGHGHSRTMLRERRKAWIR